MTWTGGGTVTLLFTDLVRSTELLEKLGDDEAERLWHAHFTLLRQALTARGGQEVKTIGDAIMAVFPSSLDAVACAVAMQQALHRHSQSQPAEQRLSLRVGLHAGEPLRTQGDYFGTPVVVAQRLCENAKGGQILVSELVRGLVGSRGGYTFGKLRSFKLKGFAEAAKACAVAWEPAVDQPVAEGPVVAEAQRRLPLPPMLAASERTPYVGREREREALRRRWDRARAGVRQLVLLQGEPGIGKTRLAEEFARAVHAEGATVLIGHCYEEAVTPYQPFVEALRYYVGAAPLDELRAQLATTGAELTKLVPELAQRLPELPEPPRDDPERERYRLFEAVTWLLIEASRACPLVLILDDLHWAGKPTLLLLKHIVRAPEPSPLLILGTYREADLSRAHPLTETLAEVRRNPAFERISLRGLDEGNVSALVGARAGQRAPPAFVHAVREQTDGNPFFIEEVLRHLEEAGAVSPPEGRWPSTLTIAQLGIPEGVKEVIGRRLLRLSDECHSALSIASVIGREFELNVLERVSALTGDRLLEVLEEAMAARVLAETPRKGGRCSFTHPLTRQTPYEELSRARRGRLHQRIGEVMEELSGAEQAHLPELAHHFFEAAWATGDTARAVEYCERAGAQATAQLAYEEAVGHHERALQALEMQKPPDEARRGELLLALGDAQWRSGDLPTARRTFQEAADLARGTGSSEQLARAALGLGAGGMVVGVADESLIGLLEDALDALADGDSALRVLLLVRLADALYFTDLWERRAKLYEEAVEMAGRIGDPATLATALRGRWRFSLWRPEKIEARLTAGLDILRLAEEAGERDLALAAHHDRLLDLLGLGEITAAEAEIELTTRLAQELRQPRYLWFSRLSWAMLALLRGQFEEGERLAQEALVLGQRAHDPAALLTSGTQMFLVRRQQGRIEELRAAFEGFVQQYPAVPALRGGLAYLHMEAGRALEASSEFEALAANKFAGLPHDAYWLVGLVCLSDVCAFLGDNGRAATLHHLLVPFSRFNGTVSLAISTGSVSRSLGVLASTMRRWKQAAQHFEDALALNARMGARPWVAETQRDYAQMLATRGRPGDRAKALELLDQALSTGQALGMKRLIEQVLALKEGLR